MAQDAVALRRADLRTAVVHRGDRGANEWRSSATAAKATLSLRDSGVDLRIGLPEDSQSRIEAEREGPRVLTAADAVNEANVIVVLAPDRVQHKLYAEEIAPHLVPDDTLVFSHGLNIRFGYITPPESVDVFMVAPKGPGHLVCREYVDGRGVPILVVVKKDASGTAWNRALSYPQAIGGRRN